MKSLPPLIVLLFLLPVALKGVPYFNTVFDRETDLVFFCL